MAVGFYCKTEVAVVLSLRVELIGGPFISTLGYSWPVERHLHLSYTTNYDSEVKSVITEQKTNYEGRLAVLGCISLLNVSNKLDVAYRISPERRDKQPMCRDESCNTQKSNGLYQNATKYIQNLCIRHLYLR